MMPNEIKSIRNPDGSFPREFWANGKKYIIRTNQEGMGIMRYSEMRKMGMVAGFNATFENMANNINELQKNYNSLVTKDPKLLEMGLLLDSMRRGLVDTSKQRYDFAFYYCTLFISWENEDLTKWVKEEQETKIDDWAKEGLHEGDFLSLALSTVQGFIPIYLEYSEKIKEMNAVYSSVTGEGKAAKP